MNKHNWKGEGKAEQLCAWSLRFDDASAACIQTNHALLMYCVSVYTYCMCIHIYIYICTRYMWQTIHCPSHSHLSCSCNDVLFLLTLSAVTLRALHNAVFLHILFPVLFLVIDTSRMCEVCTHFPARYSTSKPQMGGQLGIPKPWMFCSWRPLYCPLLPQLSRLRLAMNCLNKLCDTDQEEQTQGLHQNS